MYLAYSLLLAIGLLVYFPLSLIRAVAYGKTIASLRQRLGFVPTLTGKAVVWLHCVSVGEAQAARPLVQRLKREFPDYDLVVSTTTVAGQNHAFTAFGQLATKVIYYPVDWRWVVRRSLNRINPSVVLLMETEIWPNFLRECKQRDIPVALVNGRISPKSFRRCKSFQEYKLFTKFLERVLSSLRMVLMQTQEDAQRLQDLGMPAGRVVVTGNLKFDVDLASESAPKTDEIQRRFVIDSDRPLIVSASTHPSEEQIVIESFKQLRSKHPVRLLLAPRRPERFKEVATLLDNSGLSWAKRTSSEAPDDANAEVILLDTIGELTATFPLAQIAFVGGSFIKQGGHNLAEPAAVGVAVVTGAYTDNFRDMVKRMKEANAVVQLPVLKGTAASDELARVFDDLLSNPGKREELGRRAKQMVTDNRGAADRTLKLITPLFSHSS